MLTALDESFLHQAPTTFAAAATTDHRFYDRCWFAAYDPAGGTSLTMGMGLYKNMNVADGFCCVVRGARQHNTRVSRILRPELDRAGVGPLRYDVLEPLQSVRVVLAPGEHGLSCELVLRSTIAPFVEDRTTTEVNGRVATDVRRYSQTGVVEGWIEVGEERIAVKNWFGARDHSWGVRGGVGGFEPYNGPNVLSDRGFLVTWLLFSADGMAGYAQRNEDADGRLLFLDGCIRFDSERQRPDLRVVAVDQEIRFPQGSRNYEHAELLVTTEDGAEWELECRPLVAPVAMKGTGYDAGFADGKGLGVYRGRELVEHDVYDLSAPSTVRAVPGGAVVPSMHREQPVSIVRGTETTTGHFSVLPFGELPRYGLTTVPHDERERLRGDSGKA